MFKSLVLLFSEADVVFYILYSLSLGLFIAKIFLPRQWLLSIAGFVMAVGAITERCAISKNDSKNMIFYIIFASLILFVVCAIVKFSAALAVVNKQRRKMAEVKGNKVPLTPEGNPDYSFLLGKVGMVVSDLKPTGKVEIQGAIYEVSSMSDYILAGSVVKVVKVLVSRVFVEKQ